MKLNHFTDIGLRILMYMSRKETVSTITELSQQFNISRNHLVKVVQFLSNNNIIAAQRGRGGGLKLADAPESIKIGRLVKLLEQNDSVISCSTAYCLLHGNCLLKHALDNAFQEFITYLDKFSLKDVTQGKTGLLLEELITLQVPTPVVT